MTEVNEKLVELEKKIDQIGSRFSTVWSVGYGDEEIDLAGIFRFLWQKKWRFMGIVVAFSVFGLVYGKMLPNEYSSSALLSPAEENSGGGLAGLAGRFGGFASLAGVNLGGAGDEKTTLAIEILKSREFISNFVSDKDLAVKLMASNGWDAKENVLIYDPSIYDKQSKAWVRRAKPPFGVEPSNMEIVKVFKERMSISRDKDSGLISIGFTHYSPYLAKEIVDNLISSINDVVREREVGEAERSIKFLKAQLAETGVSQMQVVFYQLIEEQTKKIMLAMVRDDYVFRVVDPAVVPVLKVKPSRFLILFVFACIGIIVGCIYVLLCTLIGAHSKTSS